MSSEDDAAVWVKWARAKRALVAQVPYVARVLTELVPVARPGLGTTGISKDWRFYFDPELTLLQSDALNASDIMHEVLHRLLQTHERGKTCGCATNVDHYRMNIAGDICIYQMLEEMKLSLKEGDASPAAFDVPPGLTHEQYYSLLVQRAVQPPAFIGLRFGQCGSGAGTGDPSGVYNDAEHVGKSLAVQEDIRKAFAQAVQSYATGHGTGALPGALAVWADAVLAPPQVPWTQQLRMLLRTSLRVAQAAGRVDKYHRRHSSQPAVGDVPGAPRLSTPHRRLPQVELVFDTSGSMLGDSIVEAVSEAQGVFRTIRSAVSWVAIDTEIQYIGSARSARDIVEVLRERGGGGGTLFRQYFLQLQTQKRPPDLVVFFTDGEVGDLSDLPTPRSTDVLWAVTGKSEMRPPFGRVVCIENTVSAPNETTPEYEDMDL